MKHTPGPWRAIQKSMEEFDIVGPEHKNRDDCQYIAEVFGIWADAFTSQGSANARLIAAAPDLLAACEAIRDTCPGTWQLPENWVEAWKSMLAAIARAKGEAS